MCYELFLTLTGLDDQFSPSIFIPGIPLAGDNFTITCTVTGPDRLAAIPKLLWLVAVNPTMEIPVTEAEAIIGNVTIDDVVANGSASFSRALRFISIRTSQARQYSCTALLSGNSYTSMLRDLHVQSMSQLLLCNTM